MDKELICIGCCKDELLKAKAIWNNTGYYCYRCQMGESTKYPKSLGSLERVNKLNLKPT